MSLFGDILKGVAPILGGLLGGPTGAAAASAVVGAINGSKSSSVAAPIPAGFSTIAPSGFNPACYLQNNPDVATDPVFAADPYLHYTRHGMSEGRNTQCQTPESVSGVQPMSLLPMLPAVIRSTLPAVLPGVGQVISGAVKSVGKVITGGIAGAVVVDQMGNIIGRTRRRRSMNALNPRAANRAIRRIKAVRKFCQRIESRLPKQRTKGCSTRSKAKCR